MVLGVTAWPTRLMQSLIANVRPLLDRVQDTPHAVGVQDKGPGDRFH
jgi:hypothetical protein